MEPRGLVETLRDLTARLAAPPNEGRGALPSDLRAELERLAGVLASWLDGGPTAEERRALAEFQLRTETTVRSARDAIYWLSADGAIVYVNDAACHSLGYTHEELLAITVFDLDPTLSRERWDAAWRATQEAGPRLLETLQRTRDGREFPVEIAITPIDSADRQYYCCFARDITKRKAADAALRSSEAKLRSILRAAPVGIGAVHERHFREANDRLCEMLGYTRDELIGQSARMIYLDEEEFLRVGREKYAQIAATGFGQIETVMRHKDGHGIDVLLSSAPLDPGDLSLGTTFAALDITERKRVETLLHESQKVARLGHYRFDARTGRWESSKILDGVFGIDDRFVRDVAGWQSLVHPDDRDAMGAYFREEVLRDGRDFDREYRIVRASDGAERWVHGLGRLEKDASGAVIWMLGTIQDVTERKQSEVARERLEAQLVQAQKMESIGRLAGGVAHDFNNMLSVILGYAELIQAQLPADDPLAPLIRGIESAAIRSRDITRQLLAFSRRQIIAPRRIDLNAHLEAVRASLARLIGEDIALGFQPGDDVWPVLLDPSQLDQVLVNLAVNARDAMPAGGRLSIETTNVRLDEAYARDRLGCRPGEYVLLAVSDSGTGMDKEVLGHLFEPFFTTKEVGKGTGLGLSTVYGIIQQNEGVITVYSEPGRGTTFKIYFPRDVEHGTSPEEEEITEPFPGSGTILLVEDEEMVRRMTMAMLDALGYAVVEADSPERALEICNDPARELDLLLTDVVMPHMNGVELCAEVQRIRPAIKVLFMSGYTSNVIVHHGVLDPGVNFIEKPASMNLLARRIREILSRN